MSCILLETCIIVSHLFWTPVYLWKLIEFLKIWECPFFSQGTKRTPKGIKRHENRLFEVGRTEPARFPI